MKRTILMLTIVSLLAITAFAAPKGPKAPGSLGPPTLESIELTTATIDDVEDVDVYLLDWTDVEGADKYCVCVTAVAIYDTGEVDEDEEPIMAEVEVEACFGTSCRLDGGDMSDSDLNIPVEDIDALLAELDALLELMEIEEGDVESVEVTAKVKALDPSVKPTKRQNNPFSNSLEVPLP